MYRKCYCGCRGVGVALQHKLVASGCSNEGKISIGVCTLYQELCTSQRVRKKLIFMHKFIAKLKTYTGSAAKERVYSTTTMCTRDSHTALAPCDPETANPNPPPLGAVGASSDATATAQHPHQRRSSCGRLSSTSHSHRSGVRPAHPSSNNAAVPLLDPPCARVSPWRRSVRFPAPLEARISRVCWPAGCRLRAL